MNLWITTNKCDYPVVPISHAPKYSCYILLITNENSWSHGRSCFNHVQPAHGSSKEHSIYKYSLCLVETSTKKERLAAAHNQNSFW